MNKTKVVFETAEEMSEVKARTVSSWQQGESYIGFFQSSKEVDTQNGKGMIYTFSNSNEFAEKLDGRTEIWRSGGLDLSRQRNPPKPGQLVKITYDGMKSNPKNGRKFGAFSIQPANHFTEVEKIVEQVLDNVQTAEDFSDINWGAE